MLSQSNNNKRIAKNTILLYIRMLLVMGVSLYTSRAVIRSLGVQDFGIYNVVGGIVGMFSFLNGAMSMSTQRFITYEIGKKGDVPKIFGMCFCVHIIIAFFVCVLAETIGYFFLFENLNIPEIRHSAALIVYHISILCCFFSISMVPFSSLIIAYEKMNVYAYISLYEVVGKLLIIYFLSFGNTDKLVLYSILILFIQVSLLFVYIPYCRRLVPLSKVIRKYRYKEFKPLLSFTGWNIFYNLCGICCTQGLNFVLNIFFGPMANAARALSVQVQSAVNQFCTNFQMAANPQLIKSYASQNFGYLTSLVQCVSRFSFLLILVLGLPLIFNIDKVLAIWLTSVPHYTSAFVVLMLVVAAIDTLNNPLNVVINAVGKIKRISTLNGLFLLLTLPVSFMVLYFFHVDAYVVFIIQIALTSITLIFRLMYLKININLCVLNYLREVFSRIIAVLAITIILNILLGRYFNFNTNLEFLVKLSVCYILTFLCSFIIGLKKSERKYVITYILSKFKR